jgi:hypothetical protein
MSLVGMAGRIREAVRVALLIALISGLSCARMLYTPGSDLIDTLRFGLFFGLFVGLPGGLIRMVLVETAEARTRPNQGTRRSVIVAAITTLLAGLAFGLIVGPILGVILWQIGGRVGNATGHAVAVGLFLGPFFGLIVGGFAGGLFALRHFSVRLLLWMYRAAPLNYVRFLDYASERLILRKVGGGYIFIHRMVLDYFASRVDEREPTG